MMMVALAGLAEAAMSVTLMFCWGGILLVAGLALATAFWRSKPLAVVTLLFVVLVAFFLQPYHALNPFPLEDPADPDPDVDYWMIRFRIMAGVWLFVTVSAMVVSFWVLSKPQHRIFQVSPREDESSPSSSSEQPMS